MEFEPETLLLNVCHTKCLLHIDSLSEDTNSNLFPKDTKFFKVISPPQMGLRNCRRKRIPGTVNFVVEPQESYGLCPVTYNPFLFFAVGWMEHILLQTHTKATA